MSNTFRRDKLKRLILANRVVLTSSYHFDDMLGESRTAKEMPVAMTESGPDMWKTRKEGTCYLFPSDLSSKSGCCYLASSSRTDLVTLIVHSNSNYTFRILPEPFTNKE